jgi:uncharacterized membrane protein
VKGRRRKRNAGIDLGVRLEGLGISWIEYLRQIPSGTSGKGDVKAHKRKMILLYFGAILIAGAFTLTPGRYLHEMVFM